MFGINIRYLTAEIFSRKHRSLLMLGGLALGVSVWLCLNALAGAYTDAAKVPLRELGANLTVQKSGGPVPDEFEGAIMPCSNDIISGGIAEQIKDISGVEKMTSALLLWIFDADFEDASNFKMVLGIDAASEFGPGELKNGIVEGRFLATEESGKALIDEGYATITGLQAGDNLRISGRDFQIVGVVATPSASVLGATNVYMPLKEAQEIAASASQIGDFQKDDVNLIFVKVDAARLSIVQDEINTLLPGLTVSSPQSFLALMGGIASAVKRLALVGTLIALLAAVGITVRTTVSNVWERRCDIAVMKAVGWTSADVRRQVMGENLLIGLAGGALGVVIFFIFTLALRKQAVNIPLPWELNPYPHFYLSDAAKFLEIPLHVTLAWNVVLLSLFLGVALAIFTVVVASWYLAKIKPAEVFRYE